MNTTTRIPTQYEMVEWVKHADQLIADYWAKNSYKHPRHTLELMFNTKYARIAAVGDDGHRSAWGFIDMSNGDVLMSAGWKAPAKHARGNIFTHTPAQCCSWTGPNYLR